MTDKQFKQELERAERVKNRIAKDIELANQYTKEIIQIIEQKDEFTQSDLQAVVMGVVAKILSEGEN